MSGRSPDPLLRLRPMAESDLERVLEVERRAYPFPWTPGIFTDSLRVGYRCWLTERTGAVLGYGIMSVAAGEAQILNLCVDPPWQGQGLGRRMLERLLEDARRLQADTAFLEVRASNRPARELYLSCGFNEIGIRRGYYPARDGREDAVMLALSLL
jgi:[ribosomal protein S18]-alanine N-acetyltransferase